MSQIYTTDECMRQIVDYRGKICEGAPDDYVFAWYQVISLVDDYQKPIFMDGVWCVPNDSEVVDDSDFCPVCRNRMEFDGWCGCRI